ncbi:MAG: hypothetical protein ACI89X_002085 [Planctomycetota bacterium]|jgi:hypothetical protein
MKQPTWNHERRNRNVGTAKSGHGRSNRLVIPGSWNGTRVYWQDLNNAIRFELNGFTFLVEPCTNGFAHSVTVDDVTRVLRLLPHDDVARIRFIALRQPTKKQRLLSLAWGRLAYFADYGGMRGPAIAIDSQRINGVSKHPKSMSPDENEELDRLQQDGHIVTPGRRSWSVESSPDAVRRTQLFRTLPHEVGHYVQYDREVRLAAAGDLAEECRLRDLHFTKPTLDSEQFAHRYAREFGERMKLAGSFPFAPIVNRFHMKQHGLDPAWFGLSPL